MQVHAARVIDVVDVPERGRLRVTLEHGERRESLEVTAIVNCTGPAADPLGRVDAHALGLEITDDGRLIGRGGASARVWVAGPLRRPQLWESSAVLELAAQVAAVSAALRASLR